MKMTIIINTEAAENPSIEMATILRKIADDWNPQPAYRGDVASAFAMTEGSKWYDQAGKRCSRLSPGVCAELRVV